MDRCRIVIFAKAPVAGFAKTRLIPALGAHGAAELAQRLLEYTVQHTVAAKLGDVELCVTPQADHPAFVAMTQGYGVALTLQGEGDLGERMHRAFERALADYAHVIVIGTDAPALDTAMLRAAHQALHAHDAVFVPAHDGGYALVGLRKPCASLFNGMRWSTASVMQETRSRAVVASIRWHELPTVHDIDEPEDLVYLPAAWQKTNPLSDLEDLL